MMYIKANNCPGGINEIWEDSANYYLVDLCFNK